MNILAIGAHPDDVELKAGGTLAKYAAQGHKIFIATATNGNIGSAHHTMEEIAKIRKEEARRSAAIIGAEYICLDYDDEMFFETKEVRLAFINLIRHCKADVILTHYPKDYNPDHMLTSKIVTDVTVMIPIAHLKTKEPPVDKIPSIWFFEPADGMCGYIPTDYVDITDYYETKKKMFGCMESQKAWMAHNYANMREDEERFYKNMKILCEFRGMQAGVKYAESFVRDLNGKCTRMTERVLP